MKEVLATYKSSLTLDLCQNANRLIFFMRKKSAKLTKSNGKCFRCFSVANRNDASALKIHVVKKKNSVRVLYTSKRVDRHTREAEVFVTRTNISFELF